ncbi:pilus assembly protein [Tissierella creatinini]|nr:pilus assembly protein [Tissierella creatinini]TJX61509.1 pilus assembly protein [Soehngenia saccharolytica]
MSRLFRLRKNEKGQSLVEFALVLPLLILIVVGIIEFGWLFNGKITLTSAAREGARVAAILKDETTATSAVNQTAALSGLTITDVDYNYITGGPYNVNKVRVTVEGSMDPLVGLFISGPVSMEADAYMRVE